MDPYFDYVTDGYKVDDEANGGNGIVAILDWDGFSVRNFNSPAGIHKNLVVFFVVVPSAAFG